MAVQSAEDVQLHLGFVNPSMATSSILQFRNRLDPKSSPHWLKVAGLFPDQLTTQAPHVYWSACCLERWMWITATAALWKRY